MTIKQSLLKEPILEFERILELIPQKPPFVMVDRLLEYTENSGKTGFFIPQNNILLEEGTFSEPGLIEHMAQSMSLWRGYQGFLAGLNSPKTGFIGSIQSIEIFELPKVESTLTTYVEILQEFKNVTAVGAKTMDADGKLIASSEMKTVTVD
ncbi:hypothetical protein [Salegentibacter sp. F14]